MSSKSRLEKVLTDVMAELDRATLKFGVFHNPHEGYAVILEELDELWDEIKANKGRKGRAAKEAIQVAAMAIRYVYDLHNEEE